MMRVAFASNNGRDLASPAGGCRGFVIVEFTSRGWHTLGYRRNPMKRNAHRASRVTIPGEVVEGEHSHVPLLDMLADCRGLIARNVGRLLTDELTAAGVRPYEYRTGTVDEAARAFLKEQSGGGGGMMTTSQMRPPLA